MTVGPSFRVEQNERTGGLANPGGNALLELLLLRRAVDDPAHPNHACRLPGGPRRWEPKSGGVVTVAHLGVAPVASLREDAVKAVRLP
jgi:hypothetical protein